MAKILANRLKRVIPLIIRPFQGAFVAGRQILDRLLIANKLIDPRWRLKKEGVIFKIDLEKDDDHVEWDFVDYMPFKMGFGEIWSGWIRDFFLCSSQWLSSQVVQNCLEALSRGPSLSFFY